jgi:hypothetical protein
MDELEKRWRRGASAVPVVRPDNTDAMSYYETIGWGQLMTTCCEEPDVILMRSI